MNIKRLSSISVGHMALDIMASSIATILAFISNQFELTPSAIGLGALITMVTSSLTQPLFGLWADKLRGRWLGPIGLLWYASFYAMVPFAPTYPIMIALLTIGSLGSAALHTTGMVVAPDAGGERVTTATSVFFVMGQTGLALGPVITGYVLEGMGLRGLPYITLAISPVIVVMYFFLQDPIKSARSESAAVDRSETATDKKQISDDHTTSAVPTESIKWSVIATLVLLIVLRSTSLHTYMTFLPEYLKSLGYSPSQYGTMTGIFTFGSALGTLAGGLLGDRFNRRLVIFISLILSVPFCFVLLGAAGWLYIVSAFIAGGLLNISHSILIVIAQALLPQQKGMMGGFTLGGMFFAGSATAWIAGIAADYFGLGPVFYVLAFMPIAAAFSAILLPSTRESTFIQETVTSPSSGD